MTASSSLADVGTRSARITAARKRLAAAQKSRSGATAYLIYVNRPLGGQAAVAAYALGLTPTQVTQLSALCAAAGIAVLAAVAPSPAVSLAVVALLLLAYVLDSADGQLARIRGGGSAAGDWLDHVLDVVKVTALHLAILVAAARFLDLRSSAFLFVPMAFLLVESAITFSMLLRDKWMAGKSRPGEVSRARSVLQLPLDHGVLCLSLLLLPWATAFISLYTALAAVNALFAGYSLAKTYRLLQDAIPTRSGGEPAVVVNR